MWSCRLNKKSNDLPKSIANSKTVAVAAKQQSPSIAQISTFFRFHLQHAIEFCIAGLILSLVLTLAEAQAWQNFNGLRFLSYSVYIYWIVLSFIVCMERVQRRYPTLSLYQSTLIGFVLLQILIVLTSMSLNVLIHLGQNFHLRHFSSQILYENVLLHLSYGMALGALCFRYLYLREQWAQQQNSELKARIQALQARIHPHFLFNSLNNVMSLIAIDPDKAENMLLDLSRLFRASLQELKLVSLAEEIELSQRYLAIEQIRLAERLQVEWKFSHTVDLKSVPIPLLTLQPLLENSIFHGVEQFVQPSSINILIEVIEHKVNIVVINPYPRESKKQSVGHGMALSNVKQRLEAYYGQSVVVQHHRGEGIFTIVVQYQYK